MGMCWRLPASAPTDQYCPRRLSAIYGSVQRRPLLHSLVLPDEMIQSSRRQSWKVTGQHVASSDEYTLQVVGSQLPARCREHESLYHTVRLHVVRRPLQHVEVPQRDAAAVPRNRLNLTFERGLPQHVPHILEAVHFVVAERLAKEQCGLGLKDAVPARGSMPVAVHVAGHAFNAPLQVALTKRLDRHLVGDGGNPYPADPWQSEMRAEPTHDSFCRSISDPN